MSEPADGHMRESIEQHIKDIQSQLDVLEDLVAGDEQRRMAGTVADILELKASIAKLEDELQTLMNQWEAQQPLLDEVKEFGKEFTRIKTLIIGVAMGLGFTGISSVASLLTSIFGG